MKGKSMVSIGMGSCGLGVEGAKVVAEYISATSSLTACDLRDNLLDNQSEQLLRNSVKGRPSFKLQL